jgi:hypothetical protein
MSRRLSRPLRRSVIVTAGAVVAAAATTVALTTSAGASSTDTAGAGGGPAAVTVTGRVAHRLPLTLGDLGQLPQHSVDVSFQTKSGPQTHTYTGPLLYDVLA